MPSTMQRLLRAFCMFRGTTCQVAVIMVPILQKDDLKPGEVKDLP